MGYPVYFYPIGNIPLQGAEPARLTTGGREQG